MLVLLTQIEILVHSSHASDLGKVCPQYFHTYHTVPTGKLLTFILTYAEVYFFTLIRRYIVLKSSNGNKDECDIEFNRISFIKTPSFLHYKV